MNLDDIVSKIPKIVPVKRTKYFSYKYLTNPITLVEQLVREARERDLQIEIEARKNRKPANNFFNSIIDGLFHINQKPKSEEYYDGYRIGAYNAIEFCKHYFVSDTISKEKEEKLIKFLHDEGISICINPATGSIMFCNMLNVGEFIEHKIIYINETESKT